MKVKIIAILFFYISVIVFPQITHAKVTQKKTSKTNVSVSASVAKNKKSVYLYLANLQKTANVMYSLNYTTNGKSEGAGGTINTKGKYSLSRTLLFATCSSGVCRYHTKIKNIVLTVVITFQNGSSITKTFNLRV